MAVFPLMKRDPTPLPPFQPHNMARLYVFVYILMGFLMVVLPSLWLQTEISYKAGKANEFSICSHVLNCKQCKIASTQKLKTSLQSRVY